jgi:hypothetical protein
MGHRHEYREGDHTTSATKNHGGDRNLHTHVITWIDGEAYFAAADGPDNTHVHYEDRK